MYVTGEDRNGPVTTSHELRTCKTPVLCCWDLDLRYVLAVMEFGVCSREIPTLEDLIRRKKMMGGGRTGQSW